MTQSEILKEQAAATSLKYVKSGYKVGLGTGSTVKFALEGLANNLKNGTLKNIEGIATSSSTEKIATELGIPLITFSKVTTLDVYIDGADEIDSSFDMIKGGGGALIREKIVAQNSRLRVIIVDESKLSQKIGERWAVPLEVFPMAVAVEMEYLKTLNAVSQLRLDGSGNPLVTDNGNHILDTNFGEISDARKLSHLLNSRAGIAGHGIFQELADVVIVASEVGVSEIRFGETHKFDSLFKALKYMRSN
ncbi:ribose-5-phosphate isomerase RpiA [Ignavibacteriales bacterium]